MRGPFSFPATLAVLAVAALRGACGAAAPALLREGAPLLLRRSTTPVMRSQRRATALTMQAAGDEPAAPGADVVGAPATQADAGTAVVTSPPIGPDGKADLSGMSFEERLEYLASVAPDVAAPAEEDEPNLFGFDSSNEATLWWSPKFYALCFQDLREMTWPTPKSVAQTVVTSQIAFVVIALSILIFDAISEAGIRSLVQGKPFIITFDGSSTPSRGL